MELVKIGKTLKSFGVKGLLKIHIKDAFLDDIAKADVIFIACTDGNLPYFVQVVDLSAMTISLEDVDSNEAASQLAMSEIFLKSSDVSVASDVSDDIALEKLIGYRIVDKGTTLGTITDVAEYPQQLMATIEIRNTTILIPLNEAFIEEIDIVAKTVICDLPEGLVEAQMS